MKGRQLHSIAGAVVLTLGCGGRATTAGPDASSPACFVGEAGAAPSLAVLSRSDQGILEEVPDGSSFPLMEPPQGGQILLVGVKARHLDGCSVVLSTALRLDDAPSTVVTFERRPVTLHDDGAGWLSPKNPDLLSNFSNLPACPVAAFDRPVNGTPFRLEVEAEDAAGRKGTAIVRVTPTCPDGDGRSRCACQCQANYVLGSACP